MSQLPMYDLLVLDFTRHRAGPVTSRLLADWGATIIKIEEPADLGDSMGGSREGFDYQNLHRNKQSLSLNLKTDDGQSVLKKLVGKADVVLENFRPEVKYRLGLDYDSLKSINERIICGSISGFGQTGPYCTRPAVDQIIQGMSGLMSVTGIPGSGPVRVGAAITDISAGMTLAQAVLMALYYREKTGLGQWVYTSLLESTISILDFQVARWLANGDVPTQMGNDHPTLMPIGLFPTADGQVNIAAAEDSKFRLLCKTLDIPELADFHEYSNITLRSLNRSSLLNKLKERIKYFKSAELIEKLNSVGIPCGPLYTIEEAMNDEQMNHLKMKCSINHPNLGQLSLVGQPFHSSRFCDMQTVRAAAPEHGEHTEVILKELLNYQDDEIVELRNNGVI